ncbi:hypothetical protein BJF78_02235 [Pseudonocardia sp. CNS-139]|nr:hypothetical protein BJF78_02235 [Pseudonocardia sp. CNS-139]
MTLLAVLALWQLVTVTGVFRPDQFPTMTATLAALGSALGTAQLWAAVGSTLQAGSSGWSSRRCWRWSSGRRWPRTTSRSAARPA